MKTGEQLLTSTERELLQARIARLESATDAEVICAVAAESGRYDRAESTCGLLCALAGLLGVTCLAPREIPWQDAGIGIIAWQMLAVALGFAIGSIVASYWHGLRRIFVSRAEIEDEVRRSAHHVFSMAGVGGTRHHGGVLIYVSLFERRLEVRCDRAVAERLATGDLEAIRDAVLAQVRTGRLADGLCAGLDAAEQILARALPPTAGAVDSLPNHVLTFYPRP